MWLSVCDVRVCGVVARVDVRARGVVECVDVRARGMVGCVDVRARDVVGYVRDPGVVEYVDVCACVRVDRVANIGK